MSGKMSALKETLNFLIKEAVSKEHVRLQNDLDAWAKSMKFNIVMFSLPDGKNPDVLLLTKNKRNLFMGDAKNFPIESTKNSDTLKRISGYISEYAKLVTPPKKIDGGIISIATNNLLEAKKWIVVLNFLCNMHGIKSTGGGSPNFKCLKYATKTFIIYW